MSIFNSQRAYHAFHNRFRDQAAKENSFLSTQSAQSMPTTVEPDMPPISAEAVRSIVVISALALRWYLTNNNRRKRSLANRA